VIEWDPTTSVEVVKVAVSGFDPLRAPVPIVDAPSLKVTVPDGSLIPVPENSGATVAVNVTDCPDADGFCDETTVVVVVA
jgi:hypothetical protein